MKLKELDKTLSIYSAASLPPRRLRSWRKLKAEKENLIRRRLESDFIGKRTKNGPSTRLATAIKKGRSGPAGR